MARKKSLVGCIDNPNKKNKAAADAANAAANAAVNAAVNAANATNKMKLKILNYGKNCYRKVRLTMQELKEV